MDAIESLKAVRREASEAAASIDAKIRDKLLKRARKHGMTSGGEAAELAEVWKQAASKTKRLHLEHSRHKKQH
jgi:hypothetical protein